MRSILALVPLLSLTACTDKGGTTDTTDTAVDTSTDTSTDTSEDVTPVWTTVRVETSYTLTGIYATPEAVYTVSQDGHSWVGSEGTWSGITTETDNQDLNDLWGTGVGAGLKMVAVGNGGVIATWPDATTSEAGWSYEDVGTANLGAIDGASASNLIAVGWGGVFSNASGAWAYQDIATGRRFNDVWYDGTNVMAVGESGDFAVYNNDTWADDALPTHGTMYAVDGLGISDLWAVGDSGLVAHWDGSAWTEQTITVDEVEINTSLWGVYVAADGSVYVVGNNGAAYRYDGTAWSSLETGVDNNLYAIDADSDGLIWAVGNRGMAITYDPTTATTAAR